MNIDWDMGATLAPIGYQNHFGTLRSCRSAVAQFPRAIYADIFLNGRVNGKSVLTRSEIEALQE